MRIDPCRMGAAQLARALRARKLNVREVVDAHLARLERLNPRLNAFTVVDAEGARAAAGRLDRELAAGRVRSPLHGLPVTVKDLFATRGQPTAAGSAILGERVTDFDAEAVARMRRAGMVILGKTAMTEFAFSAAGLNPHRGPARNPWDLQRIAGGSSSGAAVAVAAGIGVAALGSDTGGSVRVPAALTGVVGFKPSYDAIPRRGAFPLAWSLDHVGILARSTADVHAVFAHLASRRAAVSTRRVRIKGSRLGVVEDFCQDLDDQVARRWRSLLEALKRAGAAVEPLQLKAAGRAGAVSTAIMFAEAAAIHHEWLRTRRADYGEETRERLLRGALIPAATYLKAQQLRRVIALEIADLFASVDWLISPTVCDVAYRIDETDAASAIRLVKHTRLAPLVGIPAISLPLAAPGGLPAGLQIMGPYGADLPLLEVAEAVERLVGAAPRPPLDDPA